MTTRIGLQNNEIEEQEDQTTILQLDQELLITKFDSSIEVPQLDINVVDYESTTKFLMMKVEKFMFNVTNISKKRESQEERTSKDFQWLVDTIKSKYPGIAIPLYCIPQSDFNLAEQKCIVATLFLNYLYDHPVLKYSPEVQCFFLDKIQYLQKRKQIQKQQIKHESISNWNFVAIMSHIDKLTNKQPQNKLQLQPLMIKLLQNEPIIMQTINRLKNYLQSLKRYSKLTTEMHNKQMNIFKSPFVPELSKYQQRIQQLFSQTNDTTKKQIISSYCKVDIIINIVMENLIEYQKMFKTMLSLHSAIQSNGFSNQFVKIHETNKYLSLFMNNMEADMNVWLEYNSRLINDIVDMISI